MKTRKVVLWFLLLTATTLATAVLFTSTVFGVDEPVGVSLSVDLNQRGNPIKNVWRKQNFWDYQEDWHALAEAQPNDAVTSRFPFVKEILMMTATGGSYIGYPGCKVDRDGFVDPSDPNSGYDFSNLIRGCRNITNKGLKPVIKTGNVPIALSTNPYIDMYQMNVRPPANYTAYYNYIRACAQALVAEFGLSEVRSWSWGCFNEYENSYIFCASDNSPTTTKIAFFQTYDYTVAALESVVGASYLKIGAHSMSCDAGLWDELEFIDHCAIGTNYYTGSIGTQIDYLSVSFYENSPGDQQDFSKFNSTLHTLKTRAIEKGLTNLEYGYDEGYWLLGPDGEVPWARSLGSNYQVSWDAAAFKNACDFDVDWISRWSWSSNHVWGQVDSCSSNLARLTYKMTDESRAAVTSHGFPLNTGNNVDGVASFDETDNTVHVLVYNYNPDFNATSGETSEIIIEGIAPVSGTTVTIKQWIVDETHSNYWPTWWSERGSTAVMGSLDGEPGTSSRYDQYAGEELRDQVDKDFWNSRVSAYRTLNALMSPITTQQTITGNKLTITPALAHHAIVFYEITNAKPAPYNVNSALGKTVTVSSTAAGAAVNVVDGNLTTNWTSQSTEPQWIYVDLGITMPINKVVLQWAANYAASYEIQVSNNAVNWTDVYSTSAGSRGVETIPFKSIDARYVRMYGIQSAAQNGYSINEFEIYQPRIMTDNLNDWSKANFRSPGLVFDTTNESLLQDSSRLMRNNANSSPGEYVTYYYPGISKVTATTLYAPGETISDFKFYVSSNGTDWAKYTGWAYSDYTLPVCNWIRRTYILENIPGGTDYIKIEWRTGGSYTYSPQLGKVEISYGDPKPYIIDDINDWSKISAHSTGLVFDTANASVMLDSSRLMRNNTNISPEEYVAYNYPGISKVTAAALFTSSESITNYKFYVSPDGISWTEYSGWTCSDYTLPSTWIRRTYTLDNIPIRTNYVKIVWRTGGSYSYSPQLGKVEIIYDNPVPYISIDDANDWSMVYSHSTGLVFEKSNELLFQDSCRLTRNNTNTSPAEYIVYKYPGISNVTAMALFAPGETISDFKFYISPDGTNWTQYTGWTYSDYTLPVCGWTRRTYTLGNITAGTNYIKIEWRTGGIYSYSPQLCKVETTYSNPLPGLIDNLDDWTRMNSHSTGLVFDTANATALLDTSRLMRNNTNVSPAEYVTYNCQGIKKVTATSLFTSSEAIVDFKFYVSSDGTNWTQYTGWAYSDYILPSTWTRRTYVLDNIPAGTNHVKIEWRTGGSYTYSPQLGKVEISYGDPRPYIIDDINDWTKISSHSTGLLFETINGEVMLDTSRLMRNNTNVSPAEYVVYNYTGISKITAATLFTSLESITDFKFYVSSNGTSWTQFTDLTYSDFTLPSTWTRRTYTLKKLPEGINYIKIEWRTGGSYTYSPQLGKVEISYVN